MRQFEMIGVVALLALTTPLASAFWNTGPMWNSLRTTFALDGVVSWRPTFLGESKGYAPVPRTVSEAITGDKWVLASDSCTNGGKFNGFRYLQKKDGVIDTSISPLYDIQGSIAGLQMNIPYDALKSEPRITYKFDQVPMYLDNTVNGVHVYTLTAYFVDPSTICTTGRDPSTISASGTGTGVYFQNGTSPTQNFQAPMDRATALDNEWSDNNCFPGMGVHNWYRQETFDDNNCETILPVFLIYTKSDNKLLGFGFQHIGTSLSPRFEQPPDTAIRLIVGSKVSQCLLDNANTVGVTTMHVYLINNPLSQTCVL